MIQDLFQLGGSIYQLSQANKQSKAAKKDFKKSKKELNKMKDVYSNIDTSNPFEDITNPYAGLENTMEDLTVNQKQSEFQAQQFQQSQANILQGLRGAAGGSGIAALAQTLAQQGALASQKASASIGQQEAANQAAAAAQAGKLQTMEAKGEEDVMSRIASGEQQAQQLEMRKQGELLRLAGDENDFNQQQMQQSQAAKDQAVGGVFDSVGGIAQSVLMPGA